MLQQLGQFVGGVGAFGVLLDADGGFLVVAGLGGQHVLGLGVEGIDLSVEGLEEVDNSGFFNGQGSLVLGVDVADQEFAAVGDVDGSDGIEEGVHGEDGGFVGRSLASGEFGKDETFFGQSQGSEGGHGNSDLG